MAVFGDTLRQARAHKGVTLKEAEAATRISRHHLLALEEEKFSELPALIYQRGFVRNYAAYLDLDPNRVLAMFEDASGFVKPAEPGTPQPPLNVPNHWAPNFAIISFVVVMTAVVFAWMYSAYFVQPSESSSPTEIIPTVTPVSSDSLFVPSPTILLPTATPTPTNTPEATANGSSSDSGAGTGGQMQDAMMTLDFYAEADIDELLIIADGVKVWDGPLWAGEKTGYLSAKKFEVYTSIPSKLMIIKEDGRVFNMGEANWFTLP